MERSEPSSRRRRARVLAPALVLAMFQTSLCFAAPSPLDQATAQSLFDEAIKLVAAKKFAEACPKLEESHRLDPGMATEFRLAECHEAVGRTASAWAEFLDVADLAHKDGLTDREHVARERAAKLMQRLSRATIIVSAPNTPGLEVRRGSVVVGAAQYGSAVPLDPASYVVTASAPGKKTWTGTVDVKGEGTTVTTTVPALDDADVPAPTAKEPAPEVHTSPRVEPPPPPSLAITSGSSGRQTMNWVVGGAGVALLATGSVIGFVAKSQFDGAGNHCGAGSCDAEGKRITDDARRLGTVATVVFVVGAAVVAADVVLWLTAPSRSTAERAESARKRDDYKPRVRLGVGIVAVDGRF